MTNNTRIALLVGAAVIIGGSGLALAQMDGPPPPDGPMQGLVHKTRFADRLLADYDKNHDGKITHAEVNSVLGARFAAATHGGKFMTADQFAAIHQADFIKHMTEMFRRIDWNGDGRLSLDEFAAPQRAHFQMMDRDGTGSVSCSPTRHADFRDNPVPADEAGPAETGSDDDDHGGSFRSGWHGRSGGYGGRSSNGFGRARFCSDADLSRDGKVTRAEFDQITATHFKEATHGGPSMTLAQFIASQQVRYREMNDRMFKRLDKDGDDRLTLAEFAAPQERLFERLDKNNDGTIAPDEMKSRHGLTRRHDDTRSDRN